MRKRQHRESIVTVVAILSLFPSGFARAADLPLGGREPSRSCVPVKPKPLTCIQRAMSLVPVANTIESTVLIELFEKKDCFLSDRRPVIVKTNQEVSVFARHVFNDALFTPINGRSVKLSIVDSFGVQSPSRQLSDTRARTLSDGFLDRTITFVAQDFGVYRIKIEYTDRDTNAFVLSPNIIVNGD
jgi:hypothetical protein